MTIADSGSGLTRLNGEQVAVRPRELSPVEDSGEFACYLDTARFEHMWRIAKLFAASQMVPTMFRDKPNDCFIAIQMAIRLKVDPFMFLQATYPAPGGKPGMEGKLAIALINSSGLFKGQLKLPLSGEGDNRGCAAWAISKDDGERIDGPRVTIKTAKDEGWYARNKKWQTIPDLMLQYRAGAWFGRTYCPERLMGMQTAEELQDIDPEPAPPKKIHSRTASLLERVKGAPSDTGTTVVPEPEAIEQAAAADAASEGETIDAGTGEVRSEEAEVPAQGEEPKPVEKDPAAFLSHGTFLKALEEVAAGSNVKPSEIGPWLEQYQANNDLVLGVRTAPKVRQEAFDAFVEFVASRG